MAEAREQAIKMISPKGVAVYPWLNKPDTKFKPEGEYRVKLRVAAEPAQALIEKLQPIYDAHIEECKKAFLANPKNKGRKVKLDEQAFFSEVYDADGNPTGEIEFNFKRLASGVSKKTGQPWAIKPDLFDAQGKKLSSEAKVYGGSILKVSFEVRPYNTPKAQGIAFSMAGVQVIKLVEGGGRDATAYGFGDESNDEDADAPVDNSTSNDNSDTDEAGDDASSDGSGDNF